VQSVTDSSNNTATAVQKEPTQLCNSTTKLSVEITAAKLISHFVHFGIIAVGGITNVTNNGSNLSN